tara:strand:- start:1422 stop:3800 length:2379 start_codon:yes stop_codon:yes gene_type:complete
MHRLFFLLFFCSSITTLSQSVSFVNYTSDDGLPSSAIESIYQDQKGYIWLGTNQGISRFNSHEFEHFYSDKISNEPITYFYEDASNKLYFLTNKNEIFYFLNDSIYQGAASVREKPIKKNKRINNPKIEAHLKGKQIIQVLVDKENSVWVATQENGLFYFPFYPNLKNTYPTVITSAISASKTAVFMTKKDSILFFNMNNLELSPTKINYRPSLKSGLVFENKTLYFNGVFVYHFDKKILNISKEAAPYLLAKNKEHVYIYDTRTTIFKVNVTTNTHVKIDLKNSQKLTSLGFDHQGNLWSGYQDQILKLDSSQKAKNEPISIKGQPTIIKSSKYFDLIIATKSGGVLFKIKDSIFSIESLVLKNKKINALYVDEKQSLWVSTNTGLFVLRNGDVTSIDHVTTKNGLLSNDVSSVTIFKNELYIATKKGISILKTAALIKNEPSRVIFPYLRLDNEKIFLATKKIIVDSRYSYLTIRYLALNYKSKGAIAYRYKIEGIHKDWIVTQDLKVQFTFLPIGGEYLFEIMAQNEDGLWGPSSTLEFQFLSPFYKTWWFYMLFSLMFIGVSWKTIIYFYKRKIKIQSFKTELLKLESKALQSQMNQHFVFNSLNSIQSFIATGDVLSSEIYLAKFSKLLRKTLNNSRVAVYSLSKEIEHLELYLELEKLRFGKKLSCTITIEKELEEDLIKIPPMLIQPFIENAIIHGITPRKEGGTIHISILHQRGKALKCIVEDNGVGRRKDKNKLHPSLGTDIVLKRLSLLSNNTIQHIDYIDLKDNNGDPNGTKVTFLIPIYD